MLAQMQMSQTFEQQPHGCDVLVFVSDGSVATILQEFLARQGIRGAIAGNPAVALDIATKERPAVILVDCAYIGMGAAQSFIDKLRETETSSKIIVMAGSDRESTFAKNLGAGGILRKPFLPDDLLAVIYQALTANCR